uniref:Disease resistance R13L4/SHOC-2-like LRR domain-containing protein n=1 Tax=Triticum urartu TaxID=4572 RepID=A0A8R7V159_TRIUA
MPSSTLLPRIVEKGRFMSVLELSDLPIEKITNAIGDLFNLRHLGLRNSKVKLLPKSIEKLSNLLTLDLYRTNIEELPIGIVKLQRLRHLFVEKASDHSERVFRCLSGICIPKGLRNLQTLQTLEAQSGSIRHLGELGQLRILRIWNVKGVYCGDLCESLAQMQSLSHLTVGASDENVILRLNAPPPNLQKLRLNGQLDEDTLDQSPHFQEAGRYLYSLRLYWSQLRGDPLPSLSRLSNLTELRFSNAYNWEKLVFLTGCFPKLKTLILRDLPSLKCLEIHKGAMASLEELTLWNLSNMMEVPPGLEFLVTIRVLTFYEITPEFLRLLHNCPRIRGTRWWYTLR